MDLNNNYYHKIKFKTKIDAIGASINFYYKDTPGCTPAQERYHAFFVVWILLLAYSRLTMVNNK